MLTFRWLLIVLLFSFESRGQVTLPESINASNRFRTGIQSQYTNVMRFGFLRMEGYTSAKVVFETKIQDYTEHYFFDARGFLDSILITSVVADTSISTTRFHYLDTAQAGDTIGIVKEFWSGSLGLHTLDTFYLGNLKDTADAWDQQLRICSEHAYMSHRQDSTGKLLPYRGRKISAFSVLNYKMSREENGNFRQVVHVDNRKLYLLYDADMNLLHWENRSIPYNGYLPGYTEYFYENRLRKSKILEVFYPGSEPPHYQDPGKTNFHRKEGQLLRKFQQTEHPFGEISGMWIVRKNRKGYVKSAAYHRIVEGRFKKNYEYKFGYYR